MGRAAGPTWRRWQIRAAGGRQVTSGCCRWPQCNLYRSPVAVHIYQNVLMLTWLAAHGSAATVADEPMVTMQHLPLPRRQANVAPDPRRTCRCLSLLVEASLLKAVVQMPWRHRSGARLSTRQAAPRQHGASAGPYTPSFQQHASIYCQGPNGGGATGESCFCVRAGCFVCWVHLPKDRCTCPLHYLPITLHPL